VIAQPILFHRLKLRTRSFCAFLRMLYERPDLTSNVKQLAPPRQELYFDGSDEDIQVLKRVARELLLDVDGDPDFEESYGDHGQKHFLTELTIALLPNLEEFMTEIEYDVPDEDLVTVNRFLDSRFKKLGSKQPGLPNIRAMGFTNEDSWGFNLATPGIAVLLNAAPNLERLVFNGTHGVGTVYEEWIGNIELMAPGLQNLKVLSITQSALENSEDDFEFRQLRRVIQLCTRLEVFRFHSVGPFLGELDEGHLPPGRFIEALDSVKEKLKVLDLDLTESHYPGPAEDWILTDRSLSSFTRLESLRLDELSFCLHCVDAAYGPIPRFATETTCLTNILPKTVRFLTVILVGEGHAWMDLAQLGLVADMDFPRLEAVTAERRDGQSGLHTPAQQRTVREAFEQARVRYSFTGWDPYERIMEFDDVYSYMSRQ
jgi:hypothetical protein